MRVYKISSEYASDKSIRCGHCWDLDATHIEVTKSGDHDFYEHLVLCHSCAELAGLQICQVCEKGPKVMAIAGSIIGELTPIPTPHAG